MQERASLLPPLQAAALTISPRQIYKELDKKHLESLKTNFIHEALCRASSTD